jgi:hypothetical protein
VRERCPRSATRSPSRSSPGETFARADADLVLAILEYTLASHQVKTGKLTHQADHDQWTSIRVTTRLMQEEVEAPMGSVGDSCDKALAENWMLIQTEGLRSSTATC